MGGGDYRGDVRCGGVERGLVDINLGKAREEEVGNTSWRCCFWADCWFTGSILRAYFEHAHCCAAFSQQKAAGPLQYVSAEAFSIYRSPACSSRRRPGTTHSSSPI